MYTDVLSFTLQQRKDVGLGPPSLLKQIGTYNPEVANTIEIVYLTKTINDRFIRVLCCYLQWSHALRRNALKSYYGMRIWVNPRRREIFGQIWDRCLPIIMRNLASY